MGEEEKQVDNLVNDSDKGGVSERLVLCKKYLEEAKKNNKKRFERMRKNEDLYYNRVEVSGYNTSVKVNLALSDIETQLPIIADFMPTFDVVPEEENDVVFADMVQNRKRNIEEKIKLRTKSILTEKNSLIYGNGILGILPIISEDGKFEGFESSIVDPFTWLPPTDSKSMEINPYQIFATPMRIKEIERKWSVENVQSEGNLNEYRAFVIKNKEKDAVNDLSEMALVKECFFIDENGQEWLLSWVNENIILYDDKYELSRICYFDIANYRDPNTAIGIGEPELIASIIQAVNENMSRIGSNIEKIGNAKLKVRKTFWQEVKGVIFPNKNSDEVVVNEQDDIAYLNPPAMPAYAFEFIKLLMQFNDVINGMQDVTQGKKPTGITAASAIQALQEAAQSRVRFKISTEISTFMEDIGEFIVWCLKTYDDEVRTFRIKDMKTGKHIFENWDPISRFDKDGNVSAEGKVLSDSNLEIEVVAGFRPPAGRAYTEERALKLYEAEVYGIERLVMNLNEPNKKELIEEWYANHGGDKQMIPDEVREQFRQMAMEYTILVQSGNDYTDAENELFGMLQEYPTLIETADFIMFIPDENKNRILDALRKVALQAAEGNNAQN